MVLDSRMKRIADCVSRDAVVVDVGTDHGKLPIFLVESGRVKSAIASDINSMPLEKAKNNIRKCGLDGKIETVLTDGLKGISAYRPTDVVIAGMGGELIAMILSESPEVSHKARLVLQPMTKEETLRRYLCENGFRITDEHIVFSGKLYQIICAEYTGEKYEYDSAEEKIGRINIEKRGEYFIPLLNKELQTVNKIIDGKIKAGLDCEEERRLAERLNEIKGVVK